MVTEEEETIIEEVVIEEVTDHQTTIVMIGTVGTIEEHHSRGKITTTEDKMIDLQITLTKFKRIDKIDQEMATPTIRATETAREEMTEEMGTETGRKVGDLEEVAVVEVARIVVEMNKSYRKIKKLPKISSINNSCNFKPRTEVTLRYLSKLNKKNWIISSRNSWPNKKRR